MGRIIAVDVDEVLGQFILQLTKFYNENADAYSFAKPKSLQPEDFFSYRFCEVWGGTDEQSIQIVEDFFASPYFTDGLPLVPGAVEGVKALKDAGYTLAVVTSRQLFLEDITRRWLVANFPAGTFSCVVFGNHWASKGRKISKPELCKSLKAELIIDDAVSYCRQCADDDIRALLFGEYEWNKTEGGDPLPSGVHRVKNWHDVVKYLT